jgi:peptidoglycan biosynthesis protein MviN/MurJ (putative lipid II flippase)
MRKNIKSLLRDVLCSLPMGVAAYLICSLGDWTVSGNVIEKVCLLGLGIVIGLGIYLACSFWTKNEEMIFLLKLVRKRK